MRNFLRDFLQQAETSAKLHDEGVFAIAIVRAHLTDNIEVEALVEPLSIDIAAAHVEGNAFTFGAEMLEHQSANALTATSFRYGDVGDVIASDVFFVEHVADDLPIERGDDTAVERCQAKEGKVVCLPRCLEAFLLDGEKAGPVGGPINRTQFYLQLFDLRLCGLKMAGSLARPLRRELLRWESDAHKCPLSSPWA